MPDLTLPDEANQSDRFPYARTDAQFVLVRKPDAQGTVVAKFEKSPNGDNRFPKDLYDIDSLVVTFPGSRSAFESATVDQANADLTDEEKTVLRKAGYPAL